MSEESKFLGLSPEYKVSADYGGTTLRGTLEAVVDVAGAEQYMLKMHEELTKVPAYSKLRLFTQIYARVSPGDTRLPEAFLDGGAIAVDCVRLFLPHLLPQLDAKLSTTFEQIERKTAKNPSAFTSKPRERFVAAVRFDGSQHFDEYGENHKGVLEYVRRTRHYDDPAMSSLKDGFGFTMEQAALAEIDDRTQKMAPELSYAERSVAHDYARAENLDQPTSVDPHTWFDLELARTIAAGSATRGRHGV